MTLPPESEPLHPEVRPVVDLPEVVERAAGVGSYSWTPGGSVHWSEGFYRVLGLTPSADMTSEAFFERVHEEDRQRVREATERAAAGHVETVRYRIVRPDGALRWLRGSAELLRDEDGRVARVIGAIVDETDLRVAMQHVERTHALLAESQRAAGVGSFVMDPQSGRVECSSELVRIFGGVPEQGLTVTLALERVHPDDGPRAMTWSSELRLGSAEVPPLRVRIVQPDGALRHVLAHARLVDTEEGLCVMGVVLDVTAQTELEEQLRHAAKMDAIGNLAAGVAHDFNNYLMVIGMQLELMRRRLGRAADAMVAESLHAVDQCATLTRQLLAFGRREPVSIRPVEVTAIVTGATNMLTRLLGANIELTTHLVVGRTVIDADARQIEGALVNLVVNARDAMPDGGRLSIGADVVEVAEADARLQNGVQPGRYVRLTVADTGKGIAPEHLPHIFEPYFTTKTLGHGTGLGLASVYGTVRQHRGFISVRSVMGQGTTFEVFLPARPTVTADTSRSRGSGPDVAEAGTVLVVEDLDALRATLADSLRELGHVVHTAVDGVAALEVLRAQAGVDVVLTDVMMPRMGGLELLRELRAQELDVAVVIMTGFADERVMKQIDALDPRPPVLFKPIDPDDLRRVVAKTIAKRAERAS